MKRYFTLALIFAGVLLAGGYFLYRTLVPEIIAGAVLSDSLPAYIPKRLQTRVEAIRKPMNKGTGAIIEKMRDAEIPLEEVLDWIDNISEEQAYAFLDEFNKKKPATTDEVFDIAKEHFPSKFDPEVFREPFNRHFEIKQIRNAVVYANINRKSNDVELATAKAILKKIIIEKDKELRK
jgi:hypothetical protein